MFGDMRRSKQMLPAEMTVEILRRGTAGVLAVADADSYPYAVPLSYVFAEDRLYFHSAKAGHKLDLIQANARVSFCVIDQDQIVAPELTTYFRSAIVFGRAVIVQDEQEKQQALELLAEKYSPGYEAEAQTSIQKQWNAVQVVRVDIDHMTGKEAIELVRGRKPA